MTRPGKSEQRRSNGGQVGVEPRPVKGEPGSRKRRVEAEEGESTQSGRHGVADRRVLRSQYMAVKNLINDKRDDISSVDSDKFNNIINQVESLHELVQKPREQVADAEALLDITNTLVTSVKSQNSEGITPTDFVTCLLLNFGQQNGVAGAETSEVSSLAWKDVGVDVCHLFRNVSGCCTMLGPMNTEMKQRKTVVQRKRTKPTSTQRPEDLDGAETEEKTDTDKNMATMFDVLRKHRSVRLENLVLNRNSFAQTVENLFAMSFLVKDGRAEIAVDDNGFHLVSPRNAPAANAVASGDAMYHHFVFRFDFKDWKLMKDNVDINEELMPHRNPSEISTQTQAESIPQSPSATGGDPTTPIRKFCRNRGLVIQEKSIVEDSPENDDPNMEAAAIRKGKRKIIR